MSDSGQDTNSGTEGALGMMWELAGHATEAFGGLPIAGSVLHGALAGAHGVEMLMAGHEAGDANTSPEQRSKLLAEADEQGDEVKKNMIEAIPFVGTAYGMATAPATVGGPAGAGGSGADAGGNTDASSDLPGGA